MHDKEQERNLGLDEVILPEYDSKSEGDIKLVRDIGKGR